MPSAERERNNAALHRLFADDDEEEDVQLLPDLDLEQVAREARERARGALNVGQAQTQAASADAGMGLGDSGRKRKNRDDDEEEEGAKKRKPLAKIDAERLLGTHGFPALLKQVKGFKPKGKSYEKEDLDRVMTIYQLWAHRMFPKRKFADTVERVEKVCREKRMLVALSVWRDEMDPNRPLESVADAPNGGGSSEHGGDAVSGDEAGNHNSSSPRRQSSAVQPTASASHAAVDDEEDEAIWAEIMGRMNAAASKTNGSDSLPAAPEKQQAQEDDEDALWDELMRQEAATSASKSSTAVLEKPREQEDEEDALWDELMRQEEASAALKPSAVTAASGKPRQQEEDEDAIWNELRPDELPRAAPDPPIGDSATKPLAGHDESDEMENDLRESEKQATAAVEGTDDSNGGTINKEQETGSGHNETAGNTAASPPPTEERE